MHQLAKPRYDDLTAPLIRGHLCSRGADNGGNQFAADKMPQRRRINLVPY
jgi:hypothetical protein